MNCPICNNKMPFGLQIHLAAAHGSERIKQQLRSAEEGNENSANYRQQSPTKDKRSTPIAKKPRNRVYLTRHF